MRIRAGGHMIAVLYRRADTRKLQGGFTGDDGVVRVCKLEPYAPAERCATRVRSGAWGRANESQWRYGSSDGAAIDHV